MKKDTFSLSKVQFCLIKYVTEIYFCLIKRYSLPASIYILNKLPTCSQKYFSFSLQTLSMLILKTSFKKESQICILHKDGIWTVYCKVSANVWFKFRGGFISIFLTNMQVWIPSGNEYVSTFFTFIISKWKIMEKHRKC